MKPEERTNLGPVRAQVGGREQNRAPEGRPRKPVQLGRRAGHFPSDLTWINSPKIEGETSLNILK